MMQRGTDLNRQNISCSICLDLLTDPTTIPCGHSFCRNCITSHWDGEDQRGMYSCPECRDRFTLRPSLQKNTTLAALVEQLKKAGLQDAPADHCYAGPGDVACDVCSGRKLKASKCCLVCQVYFCEKHLQPHYESPSFKKHKLVDPNKNLQENICSHHDEVMKIFCRTDQQIICYLCLMDEHKGHDTVSNAAERTEKQKELEESLQQIQQGIQEREKDVKLLQQEVEAISVSADEAVQDSEEIFSQLIRLIQKRSSDLKQQIRSQQETEVSRVKELQEKLEKELSELKRKDAELQKLSHTEDHNQFLHSYPSLPSPSQAAHSSSLSIRPLRYFQEVKAAVSELRDELQDILRDRWTNISQKVTNVDVLLSPEPETRAGFLRYAADITLDPDTANSHLLVSAGSRRATYTKQAQPHRHHPDRFTYWCQALSRECLTGRCYWELDWGGVVEITVAYRSVSRAGNLDESRFGSNDRSWSLRCDTNVYEFWHNNVRVPVSGPRSSRVGVFLDHRAGILAFYSVSETTSLLHRVQTTFTQPLHAGVWLSYSEESTAELVELK